MVDKKMAHPPRRSTLALLEEGRGVLHDALFEEEHGLYAYQYLHVAPRYFVAPNAWMLRKESASLL